MRLKKNSKEKLICQPTLVFRDKLNNSQLKCNQYYITNSFCIQFDLMDRKLKRKLSVKNKSTEQLVIIDWKF